MKKFFTIDAENNIAAFATKDAAEANAEAVFSTEAQFAKLAESFPGSRLTEIWNSLPGVVPVKKFKDRVTGVGRIFQAVCDKLEPVAEDNGPLYVGGKGAPPAEEPAAAETSKKKAAKKAAKTAAAEKDGSGSKKDQVVAMMRRAEGATLNEIMAATGWQKHTVRGFMAGAMKKAGLEVKSEKRGDDRVYSLPAEAEAK